MGNSGELRRSPDWKNGRMQHAKRRLPSSAADRPGHRRIPQAKGIKFAWIEQVERADFLTTRWTFLVLMRMSAV